ncbi:MAG: 30S ribosomal protein S5 [Planctomycetes bacterium]|nr:30S ribosomal protein S5 [Planctomycetota bacterium]
MSGHNQESRDSDSTTVGVYRTSTTVAGGRRFSFAAMVVTGDRQGGVGVGYAKSTQVPSAVEKAEKESRRKQKKFNMQGRTIPHMVEGRYGASKVRLVPAAPGTGVIAGAAVRSILDMIGVQDCLTKCFGSSNPKNLIKATMLALGKLRTREMVEALRGITLANTEVEDAITRGSAAVPAARGAQKAQGPVNTVGDERRGGRGGGRGGAGGGRGGMGGGRSGGGRSGPGRGRGPDAAAPLAADPPAQAS